jgi:hypothetical protein
MKFEEIVIKYEPHGCEYTWYEEGNCLFTRHDDTEDWSEVMLEHCIAEGINHYEVFKHFGREKWYVDFLFDSAQENEQGVSREVKDET